MTEGLVKLQDRHTWDKSDTLLLMRIILPTILGIALIALGFTTRFFYLVIIGSLLTGIGIGTVYGASVMRQLMLKWLVRIGIKIEGRLGKEIVTFYQPIKEE